MIAVEKRWLCVAIKEGMVEDQMQWHAKCNDRALGEPARTMFSRAGFAGYEFLLLFAEKSKKALKARLAISKELDYQNIPILNLENRI
ncbi:MAG: hypothetical protein H6582_00005 [Crocinitomicaceae bacterium]|nr:hypothetical protein [Crocinitomicaceae bacterium]